MKKIVTKVVDGQIDILPGLAWMIWLVFWFCAHIFIQKIILWVDQCNVK